MLKKEITQRILSSQTRNQCGDSGSAFAPANIALCKYWGKRNEELNLPCQSNISISLGDLGTHTIIFPLQNANEDIIILNKKNIPINDIFAARIIDFLNLFRPDGMYFQIETISNIPTAAGVASSASGFAALVGSLNDLFSWQLDKRSLSILARLGSGSACRSLWHGFVEWQAGSSKDGMDSYGQLLPEKWHELRIGLLILSDKKKNISSRVAMKLSMSSPFFQQWLLKCKEDFDALNNAIMHHDFISFGTIVESNALAMHAVMQTAWPPIYYSLPTTISNIQKIWSAREAGLEIYFTQDAGPNLILLFLDKEIKKVASIFPDIKIVAPFGL